MIAHKGNLETSPQGTFSFPYGAAAMTRILDEIKAGKFRMKPRKLKQCYERRWNLISALRVIGFRSHSSSSIRRKKSVASTFLSLEEASEAGATYFFTKVKYMTINA
jgi:hypothetical protein